MIALALFACAGPALTFNHTATIEVVDGPGAENQAFLDLFDLAERELRVALPYGQDPTLADALIEVADRGVDVYVATDIDQQGEAGIAALLDAGIDVTLADDAVGYFDFASNMDVAWTSDQCKMTSAFAVADRKWFVGATSAGTGLDGTQIVARGQHEDVAIDLWSEHAQIYGGTDATALTAHSGGAKSIMDDRWRYGTGSDADLEVWFGPQQRLTKRVIDATYGARHSVWVMTDDLANEGLIVAMQAKAADGFDVRVIVGPHFGDSASILSRTLENDAPDVQKFQITDAEYVPTLVIVDAEDHADTQGKALFLSHDLFSASRIYRGDTLVSDQLIDGVLWQIDDWGPRNPMFLDLQGAFEAHLDRAGDL